MPMPSRVESFNEKSLRRTVDPATRVISVADLKLYLKIDGTDEDTILGYLIDAATDVAENYCKRAFISQTYKLTMDGFSGIPLDGILLSGVYNIPASYSIGGYDYISLSRLPIISISSITTYDVDNSSTVFDSSSYSLDINGGRIYLNNGYEWPTNLRDVAAVEIVYVAGYGPSVDDVPSSIKTGVMMQAAAMYDCRSQANLVEAAQGLLEPFRIDLGLA